MKILLAGYNIDRDLIERLKRGEAVDEAALTPETVSAAYARISRNPADVNVLREKSREAVEKARKSNEQIVFGLGHASIAEHACFNFDVIDVSRLAIEYLEHFRLASYTEKSQRYIKIDDNGLIPEEFSAEPLRSEFRALIQEQNEFYRRAYSEIEQTLIENGEEPKEASLKAKEDARYALPLAIRGQLGMTVNGRTLENMIQKLRAAPLAEVRELGRRLFACCGDLVPSLVKYTAPDTYHLNAGKFAARFPFVPKSDTRGGEQNSAVHLLSHSPNPDDSVLETLLFSRAPVSFDTGAAAVRKMTFEERKSLFLELFQDMNSYHSVNRVFENTEFTFEIILSATAFAQLKRHRMGTLIPQPYLPELGVTIPETMVAACVETGYLDLARRVNGVYRRLSEQNASAAAYCLTNGHRRRVLFKLNAREMYHFVRLRADKHAQWDIRAIAGEMLDRVRDTAPLTFMMACGKHEFKKIKDKVFPDEQK
ncbi:MAG: FAD-dependent thymidylate synthase [Acidobacteria bacterium]|nr:FAD-dependent thymidylate synthase [Acidobacteriota bacterium]